MKRSMMTSLMAVGGIALAVFQMMRMRNRRSIWRNMFHSANLPMNDLMRTSAQMIKTFRRKVRV